MPKPIFTVYFPPHILLLSKMYATLQRNQPYCVTFSHGRSFEVAIVLLS